MAMLVGGVVVAGRVATADVKFFSDPPTLRIRNVFRTYAVDVADVVGIERRWFGFAIPGGHLVLRMRDGSRIRIVATMGGGDVTHSLLWFEGLGLRRFKE